MGTISLRQRACLLVIIYAGLAFSEHILEYSVEDNDVSSENEQLDAVEADKVNELPKEQRWHNPVIQNRTALLDWLAKAKRDRRITKPSHESDDASEGRTWTAAEDENGGIAHARRRRSVSEVDCEGLCSRSLCPWNEEWDFDPHRTPTFVKYAVCASQQCNYDVNGVGSFAQERLQQYTFCDAVRTDIEVAMHGEEHWLTHWPIACICSRYNVATPDHHLDTFPMAASASASTSGRARTPLRTDTVSGSTVSRVSNDANSDDVTPDDVIPDTRGLRFRQMSRSQRRQIRRQNRRILRRSESFEELMARRRSERQRERQRGGANGRGSERPSANIRVAVSSRDGQL